MEFYISRLAFFSAAQERLKKQYNRLSMLRLLSVAIFIFLGYLSLQQSNNVFIIVSMIACAAAFIFFMRKHSRVSKERQRVAALIIINKNEIAYLKREEIPFGNGAGYTDTAHPYSYDLDIFGENSLYHHINRAETYKGKEKLARQLLSVLVKKDITANQEAIKEMAVKAEWRQEIMAL